MTHQLTSELVSFQLLSVPSPFDGRAFFSSGRQSLPTDEAGFRVTKPTFDEAQTLL
jgi:hypothetical protein